MRTLVFLAAVSSTSVVVGAQKGLPLREAQTFELTSAPGAPDLIDMLAQYDNPRYDWHTTRARLTTIKFYHGQVMRDPSPELMTYNQANNYPLLSRRGIFLYVRRNLLLRTAVEVGALKDFNCLSTQADIDASADAIVDAVLAVYEAGGNVHRLDIDTALGALRCGLTPINAAGAVARWSMEVENGVNRNLRLMKAVNPVLPVTQLRFADIEPYPLRSLDEHLKYIEELENGRTVNHFQPLEIYFLDIDHQRVADETLARDFEALLAFCHARGLKVGVIINGDDSNSPSTDTDLFYVQTALTRLAKYKRLGLLDGADVVMVQSWMTASNGLRTIPVNVPEHGWTQTALLMKVLECAATAVEECDLMAAP